MGATFFSSLQKFLNLRAGKQLKKSIKRIDDLKGLEFTNKNAPSLSPDSSLLDALEMFVKIYTRAIVIIEREKVQGIMTKKDLLVELITCDFEKLESTSISTLMKKKYSSIFPENTFTQAFQTLMKSEDEVCIVEKNRLYSGVIDFSDILDVFRASNFSIQSPPKLASAIIKKVNKIDQETTLENLIASFIRKKEEYALVYEHEEVKGIVTIKDVISAMHKNMGRKITHAKSVMSPRVRTMHPGTSIYQVLDLSREQEFNQIPIMLEGRVIGVVTLKSLAKFYFDFLTEVQKTSQGTQIERSS